MPNETKRPGLRNFDPQTFMYEVSEEIRAGLKEDQFKSKNAGLDQQQPFDKQVQKTQGKSSK